MKVLISVVLAFLFFSSCKDKQDPLLNLESKYPYENIYIGYCFHDHIYRGYTTVYYDGLDTIAFKIIQDTIYLSGQSFKNKFENNGDDLEANKGGYISAAGGFWSTGFRIMEDSIFISSRAGNSFRDRYDFHGEKL